MRKSSRKRLKLALPSPLLCWLVISFILTRDHSLVQRLIELDQLTPEEAKDHPQRNVLYRALGQSESVEVDALTRRMPAGSHLLLCSDGLWELVSDDELQTIIRNYPHPQEVCDQLIALANTYGGNDNISVIVIKMPDN
jgi:serine/threonine protein phosphatase PrpC